jgi:DNA-binding PadR family transcriptional regulator
MVGFWGLDPTTLTPGQLTYQLRRLRLHGLIERIPQSHRYRLTNFGLRSALLLSRLYARAIQPRLSLIDPHGLHSNHGLQRAFINVDKQIHTFCQE